MATTVVQVRIDSSKSNSAKLKDNPTANGSRGLFLDSGDVLQIEIDTTSFPSGTVFQSITFYPTADESANGASGSFANRSNAMTVTGTRSAGGSVNLFSVTWSVGNLARPIFITDSESNGGDSAWFAVVLATPTGTTYTLDPELVNTSGSGTGWLPTRPATLSSVALA